MPVPRRRRRQKNILFKKKQESNDEYYLVDHSTITYLVLPKYGFVEFFRADTSPEIMAETTACFVENS